MKNKKIIFIISELNYGGTQKTVIKLIENEEIEKEGLMRGKYFLKDVPKKDRALITLLRNKTNNEVFKYLLKKSKSNDTADTKEIIKKVKKSNSTISVSLKILQKNNIIERVIMNKNSKLTNDIGYRISNEKLWTAYFMKYNL